jgi:3-hydroxybutyrate dehydrogenase
MTASTRSFSVLVTGAASGIGQGFVSHLAAHGHRVVAADIDLQGLEHTRESARVAGYDLRTAILDVTKQSSIEAAMSALTQDPPDVLINNAGLQHVATIEEFPREKWEQLIGVMLTGAAMLTRAVLPGMRTRDFGRIINIGSVHSLVGSPYKSAYVAAKHGLVGFSKVLALETGDADITVNTVCPGYVKTPLVDAQIEALARKHGIPPAQVVQEIMLKPMPKKRFIELSELNGIIEFLLSDAARNITGQCITVDGGWTAH